jgi:AraC-like DNA-binding protein
MPDPVALGLPLQIRPMLHGELLIDRGWNRFRGHRIPYWILFINSRRGAFLRLDGGRMHALVPARAHLIPPWVRFDCHFDAARAVPHLWSVFDVVGIPGSLVREVFPTVRSVPLGSALAATARRAREALAACPPAAPVPVCAMSSLLYAAIGELLGSLPPAESTRLFAAHAPDNRLAPALALIDSRLERPVGNRALASACGLSEHHFIRRFHRQIGQTPAQYRLERRVAEGARLLATSDRAIDDIAARCGFTDRFYFTRIFSRLMGLAPAAYRLKRFVGTAAPAPVARPGS